MKIVFRCNHCESINEIPEEFRYRLCKKCSNLTTYQEGEAILCEEKDDCIEFTQETSLSMKLAEKFFNIAEKHTEQIQLISMRHDNMSGRFLDIPSASNAPRFAASIIPRPPPVITQRSSSTSFLPSSLAF